MRKYDITIKAIISVESLYNPSGPISIDDGRMIAEEAINVLKMDMITFPEMKSSSFGIDRYRVSYTYDESIVDMGQLKLKEG